MIAMLTVAVLGNHYPTGHGTIRESSGFFGGEIREFPLSFTHGPSAGRSE